MFCEFFIRGWVIRGEIFGSVFEVFVGIGFVVVFFVVVWSELGWCWVLCSDYSWVGVWVF